MGYFKALVGGLLGFEPLTCDLPLTKNTAKCFLTSSGCISTGTDCDIKIVVTSFMVLQPGIHLGSMHVCCASHSVERDELFIHELKSIEQCFAVVLFIMLYLVALNLESVGEMLTFNHCTLSVYSGT